MINQVCDELPLRTAHIFNPYHPCVSVWQSTGWRGGSERAQAAMRWVLVAVRPAAGTQLFWRACCCVTAETLVPWAQRASSAVWAVRRLSVQSWRCQCCMWHCQLSAANAEPHRPQVPRAISTGSFSVCLSFYFCLFCFLSVCLSVHLSTRLPTVCPSVCVI